MAPYIADNQAGYTEHYIKSGDPVLGLSKTSHTLGKPTPGSPGVRREGLEHHTETSITAPTIRVIHIFAPKIIKTDVANFRSIVQRLTGRPRKADTGTQRRARTKTVPACVAVTSPDSSGFQDTDFQFLNHQSISTPRDSMSQSVVGASMEQDSPVGCNTMEIDNCSLTSNSVDSTFSFYNSMDSHTSNHESPGAYQGSMHPPVSAEASSFFSHRQSPYALNEIPAPFFSGDILHSTEFMPSNSQDYAYQTHVPITSRDYSIPPPSIPPLDYNGLAGFSELDIFTGLQGSALPDLPMNLPPLVSGSSHGLFYDTIFMPPPLCR